MVQPVNTYKARSARRSGFTLVELLAVVGIVALLLALVVRLTSYAKTRGKVANTRAKIQQIQNALEDYKLKKGIYPANLIRLRSDLPENFQYNQANTEILDPWEQAFRYDPAGESYELYSLGPRPDIDTDDIYPGQ